MEALGRRRKTQQDVFVGPDPERVNAYVVRGRECRALAVVGRAIGLFPGRWWTHVSCPLLVSASYITFSVRFVRARGATPSNEWPKSARRSCRCVTEPA